MALASPVFPAPPLFAAGGEELGQLVPKAVAVMGAIVVGQRGAAGARVFVAAGGLELGVGGWVRSSEEERERNARANPRSLRDHGMRKEAK